MFVFDSEHAVASRVGLVDWLQIIFYSGGALCVGYFVGLMDRVALYSG